MDTLDTAEITFDETVKNLLLLDEELWQPASLVDAAGACLSEGLAIHPDNAFPNSGFDAAEGAKDDPNLVGLAVFRMEGDGPETEVCESAVKIVFRPTESYDIVDPELYSQVPDPVARHVTFRYGHLVKV